MRLVRPIFGNVGTHPKRCYGVLIAATVRLRRNRRSECVSASALQQERTARDP